MPKTRVRWTDLALADLRAIRAYVRRDNPLAARRLGAQIKRAVSHLRDHPASGRIVPELSVRGFREVIVAPYRIVYHARGREVVLLRVWHGRREIDQ